MTLYKVTRSDGSWFIVEASNTETAIEKASRTNGSASPILTVEPMP